MSPSFSFSSLGFQQAPGIGENQSLHYVSQVKYVKGNDTETIQNVVDQHYWYNITAVEVQEHNITLERG
jgi:hypothetical protein